MSTSWQGAHSAHAQMAASEAEKRRLGASLVMPPPASGPNTLRRTQAGQPAPASEVTVAGGTRQINLLLINFGFNCPTLRRML